MGINLDDFYTEVITEQSQNMENRGKLDRCSCAKRGYNPSCGDDITVQVLYTEDGVVDEIKYMGDGCAISRASASVMIDLLTGLDAKTAKRLVENYLRMIKGELTDEGDVEELEDAAAFRNISKMPARVKCATLAWNSMKLCLENE